MNRKKIKNKNLYNFIIYLVSILTISLFFISYLTIKNQLTKIRSEITEFENSIVKNVSIVKELQSEKEYFLSEQYISTIINNEMAVTVPEQEIINMKNDK